MILRGLMILLGMVIMILNSVFHWKHIDNDSLAAIVLVVAVYIMADMRMLSAGIHVKLSAIAGNIEDINRARNC